MFSKVERKPLYIWMWWKLFLWQFVFWHCPSAKSTPYFTTCWHCVVILCLMLCLMFCRIHGRWNPHPETLISDRPPNSTWWSKTCWQDVHCVRMIIILLLTVINKKKPGNVPHYVHLQVHTLTVGVYINRCTCFNVQKALLFTVCLKCSILSSCFSKPSLPPKSLRASHLHSSELGCLHLYRAYHHNI